MVKKATPPSFDLEDPSQRDALRAFLDNGIRSARQGICLDVASVFEKVEAELKRRRQAASSKTADKSEMTDA
jgi:hypothetical protein